MTINVTPIPQTLELTTPAFTLGTANAAGSAITAVASDSTLAVFATNALALGATAAAGDSALAVRANSTIAAFDTTVPTVYQVVGASTREARPRPHAGTITTEAGTTSR